VVASGKQQYEPEAVFDISSAIAHVPCRTRSVLSLAQTQGYEYLALEDWSFDGASSEVECIFLEEIMEDPYLWFVNAGVRQFLADSFRGRHFFFLSHFIYLGASVLDSPVDIISQPSAQVWDESRTLGEALAAIRASGDPVIGVHLRTGLPNVMMLHQVLPDSVRRSSKVVMVRDDGERRWLEVEKGYAADCCQGYLQVLREILACIQAQVEAARSRRGGPDAGDGARDAGGAGGEEKGGQQRVIVLWAADHDLVPKRIRSALTSMHGVVVVSLDSSERAAVRGDAALSTALQDMALLSAASHIVGAIQSTFTYLMYARALARPVLSLFRPGEGRQCMAHESSEGGFLLRGTFPTDCTWRPAVSLTEYPINSGRPLDFHCKARVSCVTTFQLWKNTGGKCLYPIPLIPGSSGTQQGVRAASASAGRDSGEANGSGAEYFVARSRYQMMMNFLMNNFSWATPLVSHTYDGAEYLLSHFSRYGWAVYLNDKTLSLPVCPYAPAPPNAPEKRWKWVTGGLGWAEAVGGAGGGDDDLDDMACIYADPCTEQHNSRGFPPVNRTLRLKNGAASCLGPRAVFFARAERKAFGRREGRATRGFKHRGCSKILKTRMKASLLLLLLVLNGTSGGRREAVGLAAWRSQQNAAAMRPAPLPSAANPHDAAQAAPEAGIAGNDRSASSSSSATDEEMEEEADR
jgi:hypothetical protein